MQELRARINVYIWEYDACDDAAPRSAWRHFVQIIAMVTRDLMEGMITLRAMSLVYTTLLSIVPLLAVSISVLKGFGVHDQLEPALARLLAPLGQSSAEISARIVGFVENMRIGVLGALGLGLLTYTVISLIQKIESAFNFTWRLQGNRNVMQRFSDYLSVIMVGPVLIFSAVGITASLGSNQVVDWINTLPYMGVVIKLTGKLLPYLLVIAAFTFIYVLVPNTRVRVRSAFYGAVVAGILWETSGLVFTSFISGSTQYTAIYSGFAILLLFMIWLYLCWVILLIGASIAYYHQNPDQLLWKKPSRHLSARLRDQLALQAMVNIARAFDEQSEMETDLDTLAEYQGVPTDYLLRMLDALETDELVVRSDDDPPRYLPGASLDRITLLEILHSSRGAEDDGQADSFCSDAPVNLLLRRLEESLEAELGQQTLEDFIDQFEREQADEDRILQRQ